MNLIDAEDHLCELRKMRDRSSNVSIIGLTSDLLHEFEAEHRALCYAVERAEDHVRELRSQGG